MELKDILSIIRNEYKDKLGSNLIGTYMCMGQSLLTVLICNKVILIF